MEAIKTSRVLKDTGPYQHLFPKAYFKDTTVKKSASVADTVQFIGKVVKQTRWQVARFVKQELGGLKVHDACKKLWHFVKDHIAYKKDETGIEQVRSPRRLFWERIGDCDCFTTFIDSCLSVLKIPVINRITKYNNKDYFQHIYPVVPLSNGEFIIMDCVVEQFNYEEPYTEKKDYPMDLNFLDGLPEKQNPDAAFASEQDDLGKLNLFKKKTDPVTGQKKPGIFKKVADKVSTAVKKVGTTVSTAVKKVTTALPKVVNAINKVNPATVLLRAGVLASMKLNVFKVAQRLKYAYLTDAEAQKRGVDMAKFGKIKDAMKQIEKIFYGAGGKPENLKEAILKGKGNQNREVPLSGFDTGYDIAVTGMDRNTPLTHLLGQETYYDEFMQNGQEVQGLGELGEPATATVLAAASGVMATIKLALDKIGNLFPKKTSGSTDFENAQTPDPADNVPPPPTDPTNIPQDNGSGTMNTRSTPASSLSPDDTIPDDIDYSADPGTDTNTNSNSNPPPPPPPPPPPSNDTNTTNTNNTGTNTSNTNNTGNSNQQQLSLWEKNKKWLKPTIWGTVALGGLSTLYFVFRPKNKKVKGSEVSGIDGVPSGKKKGRPPGSKNKKKIKTFKLK